MEGISNNQKVCELCGEIAKSLCLKCNIYFCDSCYNYLHEKKKKQDHKKENIDPFIPIDTKCPEHPNIPLNLFCVEEKGKINIIII